jgi:hypothetical protein
MISIEYQKEWCPLIKGRGTIQNFDTNDVAGIPENMDFIKDLRKQFMYL